MIAAILPCYRVAHKIIPLLAEFGSEVSLIIVVDDKCPEKSGQLVLDSCRDDRVHVLFNESNKGVGGAVLAGFKKAVNMGATICVKIDGDGQMNPHLISKLIKPIVEKRADFTKGNRFVDPSGLSAMPKIRLFGNALLSFICKFVTGYWSIFDPTNGFLAINSSTLKKLDLDSLHSRYFFESDLLFKLSLLRARVIDFPMQAVYSDEKSSLRIWHVVATFPWLYFKRFLQRLLTHYFLRDFSVGSVYIISGLFFHIIGFSFGLWHWIKSIQTQDPASSGTVMLAALPIILGTQFIIAAIQFDMVQEPTQILETE